MANNRRGNGHTINITTASAAVVSGNPCVQEGWFGIALGDAALGASFELAISGRWRLPVPASTVKGEFLYVPSSAGGVLLTEDEDVTADLTRTSSNAVAPVLKAMEDRDALGYADCLILPPGAARAGTQV